MGLASWTVIHLWRFGNHGTSGRANPDRPQFVQAEEGAGRRHMEPAGMTYRWLLELTLKNNVPELKGTLEKLSMNRGRRTLDPQRC